MTPTTPRRVRPSIGLLALAICALFASPASAGTYDAWSCRTQSGGPAAIGDASHGWQILRTNHSFLQADNGCSTGTGYFGGRFLAEQPVGARIRHVFVAPAHTAITGYQLHWSGVAGGTNGVTGAVGEAYVTRSDLTDPTYVVRRYGGGAFNDPTNPLSDANRVQQSGLNVSSITVGLACSPSAGQSGSCPAAYGSYRVYRSRVTLQDSSAPIVGSITGDALAKGTFAGEETLSVNATDTGSGVYRLILAVDGVDTLAKVIDSDGGRCVDVDPANANPYEFVQARPCPLSSSGDVVIDTRALAEGEHSLRLKVEDASGNRTTAWGPATKVIDNIPPPQVTDPDGAGPLTGRPTIAGVPREGNALVADPGQWTGEAIAFSYRWQRCDAAGGNCSAVAGASGRTYTLTAADVGRRIRVVVTATNREGHNSSASDPTATVAAAPCTSDCTPPGPLPPSGSGGSSPAGPLNGFGASPRGRVTVSYNGRRVIRTRYGKRVAVTGRLLDEHGAPIRAAVLDILERPKGSSDLRVTGTVTTAGDGTFAYLVPVGASRLLRFAYRYRTDATSYAHTSDIDLIVRAKVAFRATRRVSGRRPLRFSGRVPGAARPSFVLLQARVGGRWQVFEKARIRAAGRFKARYVFRRTRVPTTFRFRALYPGRDASNLEPGRSRVVKVRYTP
jgi:hypothetical protein